MSKLITIAEFSNTLDIKFSLIKDMLKQANIPYIVSNENSRIIEPYIVSPSNEAIEIKVYEEKLKEASEIINSLR